MTKCMCAALTGRMVICCDALSSKIDGEEQVKMQVHLSQEGGGVGSGSSLTMTYHKG